MGMGNPLEPGTYYVGVNAGSGTTPLSYTLVSRGIGTNQTIPVLDLPFTGGVAWSNNLPAREAAYYRVQIASNTPSWKLRLAVTNGEAHDADPEGLSAQCGRRQRYFHLAWRAGAGLQKSGDEQYLLLPD